LTAISEGFGETSRVVLYGTQGILHAHDPNQFGETITLTRKGDDRAYEMPFTHGYVRGNYRGLTVCDMAWAMKNNRKPRGSYELGLHAFEVIHGIQKSCMQGQTYCMTTRCERPRALPTGITNGLSAMEAVFDN